MVLNNRESTYRYFKLVLFELPKHGNIVFKSAFETTFLSDDVIKCLSFSAPAPPTIWLHSVLRTNQFRSWLTFFFHSNGHIT